MQKDERLPLMWATSSYQDFVSTGVEAWNPCGWLSSLCCHHRTYHECVVLVQWASKKKNCLVTMRVLVYSSTVYFQKCIVLCYLFKKVVLYRTQWQWLWLQLAREAAACAQSRIRAHASRDANQYALHKRRWSSSRTCTRIYVLIGGEVSKNDWAS